VFCLSVCLSVTFVSPGKTAEAIEIPFGLWTRVGRGDHVLDWGPDPPSEEAILSRGRAACCTVYVRQQCGLLSNYFDHLFYLRRLFHWDRFSLPKTYIKTAYDYKALISLLMLIDTVVWKDIQHGKICFGY